MITHFSGVRDKKALRLPTLSKNQMLPLVGGCGFCEKHQHTSVLLISNKAKNLLTLTQRQVIIIAEVNKMRKRLSAVVLVLCMICSFCACTDDSSSNASESEPSAGSSKSQRDEIDKVKELSEKLCLEMAEGDFEATYSLFSQNLRNELDKNGLILTWNQATADIGDFKEYHSAAYSEQGDYTVVASALEYDQSGLMVSLVYNQNEEIDGIWLDYCEFSETGEVILPTLETTSEVSDSQ